MIFHDLRAGGTAEPADWTDNTGTIPPELPPIHSLIVSDGSDSTSIICQNWDRSLKDTHRVGRPADCETVNAVRIRGRVAMAFSVIGAPSLRLYVVILDQQGGAQLAETYVDIAIPSFAPVAIEFPLITGLNIQGAGAINTLCFQYSCFCAGANDFDATIMVSELAYDYLQDLPILESYSEVVGRATTLAENEERAESNKIVMHRIDDDAIVIHAEFPETRLYTYNLHRLISPGDAALWNAFAGAGAEAGYIHHAGVRRQLPSGGLTGYYVMNMGHAPYVAWQASRAVKMLQGLMYGGPPGQHDGMIMDAVQVDLTMWYAAYDVGHENILTSTEYTGNGAAYSAACIAAFVAVQDAVRAAFPWVPGVVTPPPQVFPNFGNLAFMQNVDADTVALIAASRLIEAQQALGYANDEPNLTAEQCESRWATLVAVTTERTVLAHGLLTTASPSQAQKDRAKIAIAAWFLMAARAGLCARFATAVDAPEDISTWEQPNLLNTAAAGLGAATGEYELVAGAWVKGNVYRRAFENGRAYLFVRKAGQVGSETAVLAITTSAPYLADGSLGGATSALSLSLGEGAVLLDVTITAEGPPLILNNPPVELVTDAERIAIANHPAEFVDDTSGIVIENPPVELEGD
jgi:hypothetical protein